MHKIFGPGDQMRCVGKPQNPFCDCARLSLSLYPSKFNKPLHETILTRRMHLLARRQIFVLRKRRHDDLYDTLTGAYGPETPDSNRTGYTLNSYRVYFRGRRLRRRPGSLRRQRTPARHAQHQWTPGDAVTPSTTARSIQTAPRVHPPRRGQPSLHPGNTITTGSALHAPKAAPII